jgi:hypothetical protein
LSDGDVEREEKDPAPKAEEAEEGDQKQKIELPSSPKELDGWDREALSNLIEQLTGTKPHHNLGYLKLVSIAKQSLTANV